MAFSDILDPILSPLLQLPTVWAVIFLSFIISLLITVVYKYTTNQSLMKDLKAEMKAFQKQVKALKDNPQRMMEVQKQAMKTNMKYMSHSMKSTFYSLIPILLIFAWMTAHFAYEPLMPQEEFSVTLQFAQEAQGSVSISPPSGLSVSGSASKEIVDGNVAWLIRGDAGEYLLEFEHAGTTYSKEVMITTENKYYDPIKALKDSPLNLITIGNQKKKLMNLGFWQVGWLGTYIIFSILFSISIRKVLKVY